MNQEKCVKNTDSIYTSESHTVKFIYDIMVPNQFACVCLSERVSAVYTALPEHG